jgi:hypothetical protein
LFDKDKDNVLKDFNTANNTAITTKKKLLSATEIQIDNYFLLLESVSVISIVDCAAASADYKSAFLFGQPEVAVQFLSVLKAMQD